MTLAAIAGVCLLTASPSVPAWAAKPALAVVLQDVSNTSQQPASVEAGKDNTQTSPEEPTSATANSSQSKDSNPKGQGTGTPGTSTRDSGTARRPREPRKSNPAVHSKPAKAKTKSGTVSKKKKRRVTPPATTDKDSPPPKVVVKDGGASDPTITLAPSLNQQQAAKQRQSAEELLSKADENLKKISGRELNPNQQEMVNQIQQYMEQAKAAGNTGDLTRQRNLALKAQLLSEELAKP